MISYLSKDNFPFPETDFNLVALVISLMLSFFNTSQISYVAVGEANKRCDLQVSRIGSQARIIN